MESKYNLNTDSGLSEGKGEMTVPQSTHDLTQEETNVFEVFQNTAEPPEKK